jgi:hypothetical protein
MRIESRTEAIFAQAVALAQAGRMKSTIYVGKGAVYILNMDSTILLRIPCPQAFDTPFAFFANDYEGSEAEVVDGKIKFTTRSGNLVREKTCAVPKVDFAAIEGYWAAHKDPDKSRPITLTSGIAALLEDGLSHVEVSKGPLIVQRDIYSGSRIEVKMDMGAGSLLGDLESAAPINFKTFGLRTDDFKALFTIQNTLIFYVQPEKDWVYIEDGKTGDFKVVLARCVYDELGTLEGN